MSKQIKITLAIAVIVILGLLGYTLVRTKAGADVVVSPSTNSSLKISDFKDISSQMPSGYLNPIPNIGKTILGKNTNSQTLYLATSGFVNQQNYYNNYQYKPGLFTIKNSNLTKNEIQPSSATKDNGGDVSYRSLQTSDADIFVGGGSYLSGVSGGIQNKIFEKTNDSLTTDLFTSLQPVSRFEVGCLARDGKAIFAFGEGSTQLNFAKFDNQLSGTTDYTSELSKIIPPMPINEVESCVWNERQHFGIVSFRGTQAGDGNFWKIYFDNSGNIKAENLLPQLKIFYGGNTTLPAFDDMAYNSQIDRIALLPRTGGPKPIMYDGTKFQELTTFDLTLGGKYFINQVEPVSKGWLIAVFDPNSSGPSVKLYNIESSASSEISIPVGLFPYGPIMDISAVENDFTGEGVFITPQAKIISFKIAKSTGIAPPKVTNPLTINASSITLRGMGTPGNTITVYLDDNNDGVVDGKVMRQATVDSSGNWRAKVELKQNDDNNFLVTAQAGTRNSNGKINESAVVDVPTITQKSN